MDDYLKAFPDTNLATRAQLRRLLSEVGNADEILEKAIDNGVPPSSLVLWLDKGIKKQQKVANSQPVEKVAEPEPTKAQPYAPKEEASAEETEESAEEKPTLRDRLAGLPWMWIGIGILVLALIVAAIWFFGGSSSAGPSAPTIQLPQSQPDITQPGPDSTQPQLNIQPTGRESLKGLNWKLNLVNLGLIALIIFSLLESIASGDTLLIDFFSSWGVFSVLVYGGMYGTESHMFWFLVGAGVLGMIISTFWNPTEENEPKWWNRIDTTHWYVLGLALIFIYNMKSPTIPYPSYLPIVVPILIVVIGAGKEIFRQVIYSLVAIAIGIAPAVLQTGTALLIGLSVEVVIAAFGARQGWITSRGSGHEVNIGGRKFKLYLAWDVVLFYVAEVVLIGYALYGNYVVLTITR